MLNPKANVWKVLKKVEKLVPWIEMCKQSLLWKRKVQVERRTLNYWHGRLETYPLRYQIDTACMTNWLNYSNRIMRGSTAEYVLK